MKTVPCDEVIEILEQLSPVPVLFKSTGEEDCLGKYLHSSKEIHVMSHIVVSNNLGKRCKITTLIHEIGHAICGKKGCKCMKNSDYAQQEIHAYRFELSWLLKHKRKRELKLAVESIKGLSEPPIQHVKNWVVANQAATFYLRIDDDVNHKKWKRIAAEIINSSLSPFDCHVVAAKHIMKLKLWQRCLSYVNQKT